MNKIEDFLEELFIAYDAYTGAESHAFRAAKDEYREKRMSLIDYVNGLEERIEELMHRIDVMNEDKDGEDYQ